MPEKIIKKSGREKNFRPKNFFNKWVRKKLPPEKKNQKKYKKMFSWAFFIFSVKKKTLPRAEYVTFPNRRRP